MAYTSTAVAPRVLGTTGTAVGDTVKPGFFARLLAAMQLSRQRQAEREVAMYLANAGGKFTDEAERVIERRFLASPSRW
jgi:hypothetical protein